MLAVGVKSDVGKKRKDNQDAFYVSQNTSIPLYLVADGMGGHNAGELASNMAMNIIVESFIKNQKNLSSEKMILKIIKKSIEEANSKVYLKSLENKDFNGMGTTITLAYIFNNKIYIGHVGDSRAYLIRKGKLGQISEDHSYVNQLLKSGSITKEEAKNHPKRNMITRAVGSSSILEIDLLVKKYDKNDILILCSDGLTNMVMDFQILEQFQDGKNIQESCEELVEIANTNGGIDNITIIAIKFD